MNQQQTAAGTLLIFHHVTDGQVYQHSVSYVPGQGEFLVFSQLMSIGLTDRAILTTPGMVSLVGSVSGSYDEYVTVADTDAGLAYCPVCNPTMKGKANE